MSSTNPYAPPRAEVRDIAGGRSETAGRGTRLAGAVIDSLIFCAMVYLPFYVFVGLNAVLSGGPRSDQPATHPLIDIGVFLALVGLVTWCVLTILYVARNGQSIAKKILGIKVVRSDGSRATLGRIFWLRNFINLLLTIIPFYGLVDALVIFGEHHQCVHDKIADTIVVKA